MSWRDEVIVISGFGPIDPPSPLSLFLRSETFRHLLAGLPSLLAGVGAIAVALSAAMIDRSQVRTRYLHEAQRRFAAQDYQGAQVGFGRLAEQKGASPEAQLGLALALDAQGESERAGAILDRLAPPDRMGDPNAHLAQARRLLRAAERGPMPGALSAAEAHLLRCLRDAPDSIEANSLLGQIYLNDGQTEQAIPLLEKAAPWQPELLLILARVDKTEGRYSRSQERALRASRIFRERAETNPDDHASRLRWAEAALLLDNYPSAISILKQGADLGGDPRYPEALAEVYLAWADALGQGPDSSLSDRLVLLQRGLEHDPANLFLLNRFSAILRSRTAESGRARAALEELVASGRATGIVRYTLGLDAWERGQHDEARVHWEQACRLSPQTPVFANNLAWALAAGPRPDLIAALRTIDPVIARWPNEPRFRETRGQILVKLGRWKDALPDLEDALQVYPDSPELHHALAATYEHLGAPGLAAEHLRRTEMTTKSRDNR